MRMTVLPKKFSEITLRKPLVTRSTRQVRRPLVDARVLLRPCLDALNAHLSSQHICSTNNVSSQR